MTIYVECDSGESYAGLLITEDTTSEDIAEFSDCDPDMIGGDHDGWYVVPALSTAYGAGDVFTGDLILREENGDFTTAINPYDWDAQPE